MFIAAFFRFTHFCWKTVTVVHQMSCPVWPWTHPPSSYFHTVTAPSLGPPPGPDPVITSQQRPRRSTILHWVQQTLGARPARHQGEFWCQSDRTGPRCQPTRTPLMMSPGVGLWRVRRPLLLDPLWWRSCLGLSSCGFCVAVVFVRNVASSWNHGLIHIVVHWRARSLNIMGSFCPVDHQ